MTNRFNIFDCPLQGLKIIQRNPISDSRGYLERMYCSELLRDVFPEHRIVQINHTSTHLKGTVRGMHFQTPPFAETKFVSCLRGKIFDVAVDIRCGSRTFLKWHGEILSADNHRTILIPMGFAHGFQTLTEECELLYFHSEEYHSDAEGGLNAVDPRLSIDWPLPIAERSSRDISHPMLNDAFQGFDL